MYSKGVTTREIAYMVERMYDHCYSPTTVSNITKRTEHLVEKLHERKFKHLQYVCVFLDATYIPLRRGTVEREAVNVAIGIRSDGGKEVFDYSIAPTESGAAWSELRSVVNSNFNIFRNNFRNHFPDRSLCFFRA